MSTPLLRIGDRVHFRPLLHAHNSQFPACRAAIVTSANGEMASMTVFLNGGIAWEEGVPYSEDHEARSWHSMETCTEPTC